MNTRIRGAGTLTLPDDKQPVSLGELQMLSPVLSAMREAKRDAIPQGTTYELWCYEGTTIGSRIALCTRGANHTGPHVAHRSGGIAYYRWPRSGS